MKIQNVISIFLAAICLALIAFIVSEGISDSREELCQDCFTAQQQTQTGNIFIVSNNTVQTVPIQAGNYNCTGFYCKIPNAVYIAQVYIEGIGICYKQNNGDIHCPR